MDRPYRRVGAWAGVAYAVLAAVENLDVLQAPGFDASPEDLARFYTEAPGKLAITAGCGALSLVAYVLAVVGLWSLVTRGDGGPRSTARARSRADGAAWAVVGLAGGVIGPSIALVALGVQGTLARQLADGPALDSTGTLHQFQLGLQPLAGVPIGLFLVGTALAGRSRATLPAWLVHPALVVGAGAIALGVTTVTLGGAVRGVTVVVLGAATAWLLVTSVWLLLEDWPPARTDSPWVTTARVLAGTVTVAAGVSGAALVLFPAATPGFFSWGLGPLPLAALIGGFYLGAAVMYGAATVSLWIEARVAMVGIVALAVPVFVVTLAHLEVFDFDRAQAWAWVVLFAAFPVAAAGTLVGEASLRRRLGTPAEGDRPLRLSSRGLAAVLAVGLLAVSIGLWVDPTGAGGSLLPIAPSPLGGRVLGGWTFLGAVLAAHLAARGGAREGRLAALGLVAFPVGALLAAARTFGDLSPAVDRAAYVVALLLWAAIGGTVALDARRPAPSGRP